MIIRSAAFDVLIRFHNLFSTDKLVADFVPALLGEIESGLNSTNIWLLDNFGLAITLLLQRGVVQEEQVQILHTYFDVTIGYTRIVGRTLSQGHRCAN